MRKFLLMMVVFSCMALFGCGSDSSDGYFNGNNNNNNNRSYVPYVGIADGSKNRMILINRNTGGLLHHTSASNSSAIPQNITFSMYNGGFYLSNPSLSLISAVGINTTWETGEISWSLNGYSVPGSIVAAYTGPIFCILSKTSDPSSEAILVKSTLNADGTTAAVPTEISVLGRPVQVVVNRTANYAYVTGCGLDNCSVGIIDVAAGTLMTTLSSAGNAGIAVRLNGGYVYSVNNITKILYKIAPEGSIVASVPLTAMTSPYGVAVMGSRVYVTDTAQANVYSFDADTLEPSAVVGIVAPAKYICSSPEEDSMYISNIGTSYLSYMNTARLDTVHNNILLPDGALPMGIAIMPTLK